MNVSTCKRVFGGSWWRPPQGLTRAGKAVFASCIVHSKPTRIPSWKGRKSFFFCAARIGTRPCAWCILETLEQVCLRFCPLGMVHRNGNVEGSGDNPLMSFWGPLQEYWVEVGMLHDHEQNKTREKQRTPVGPSVVRTYLHESITVNKHYPFSALDCKDSKIYQQ